MPQDTLADQIDEVVEDVGVDTVKIGSAQFGFALQAADSVSWESLSMTSWPFLAFSTSRSTVGSSGRGSPANTSAALANNYSPVRN